MVCAGGGPVKVYLVSTGSYSDWSVRGLFSARETAEKCKALLEDSNNVEEWELDALADRVARGVTVWLVWSKEGGVVDVSHTYANGFDCLCGGEAMGRVAWFPDHGDKMRVYVEATDEAHATKIAADKFREHVVMRGSR